MRKKDNREQRMADKAVRITWFVTVMALFAGGSILRFQNDGEGRTLLLIAVLSTTLLITLEQYFLSKVKGDQEFKKMMALTALLAFGLLAIGWVISR